MTGLLPEWLKRWRGRCCWAHHDFIDPICPYTNIPREHA